MRIALALLALAAAPAFAAPVPGAPKGQVSEAVIQSWKGAGAEVRWVTTAGLWDDKPTPGCRVGFEFHGWVRGRFNALPAPEGPFCLNVSFPWPGDERQGIAWGITDDGLAELARFQNLRWLDVFGEEVTDAGAAHIAKLTGLESLGLRCTKVTATGLKELAKLPAVTRLSLSQTEVTEAMLKSVAGFERLTRLHLSFSQTEVTPAGMRHVAGLPKLGRLSVFAVNVADAATKELGRSASLRDIDFLNTGVTDTGADELRKLLPGCAMSARTVDLTIPPPPVLPPPAKN